MTAYNPNFHSVAIRAVQFVSACACSYNKLAVLNGSTILLLNLPTRRIVDLLEPAREQDQQVLELLSTSDIFQDKLNDVICTTAWLLGSFEGHKGDYCLVTRRGTSTWTEKGRLEASAECIQEGADEL